MLLTAAGASDGASEDSRKVVQASEILAAIERGEPVDYDGVIVEGDLDLSGLKLPTEHVDRTYEEINYFDLTNEVMVVESPINITNSEIRGKLGFSNAIFQKQVNFEKSNFAGSALFSGSNFSGDADFWFTEFSGGYTCFSYAKFSGGNANFWCAEFSGGAAYFKYAKFSGGNANFWGAEFSGGAADFWRSEFSGGAAEFMGVEFSGDYSDFSEAKFSGGTADFRGAEFSGGAADFSDAEIDRGAYFNYAQFNETADFTNSWFKEDVLFENTTFRGELSLTRTRYNKLYLRWHNIEGGLAYDDTAYLSLLKNFKDLGYLEDYDSCYFDYRKDRRSQLLRSGELFSWGINLLLEWFYGYGTKPLNALSFSLGIISVFGAFWRLIGLGKAEEALDEYSLADAEHDSILEVLAFSATVFLSGTRLFIEPPPLPKIRGRSRSLIRGAFIFERVLGALFSILFFLAISGTVVRQL